MLIQLVLEVRLIWFVETMDLLQLDKYLNIIIDLIKKKENPSKNDRLLETDISDEFVCPVIFKIKPEVLVNKSLGCTTSIK